MAATVTKTIKSNHALYGEYINALQTEYQWSKFTFSLTFGIPKKGSWSGYSSGTEPYVGYEELTSAQTSAVQRILMQEYRGVTGIHFSELTNEATQIPEDQKPQNADLRFGRTLYTDAIAFAYSPYPLTGTSGEADKLSGDVWIVNDGDSTAFPSGPFLQSPITGNYEYFILMHEIGHAMGLKHPHEPEIAAGTTTQIYGTMPAQYDQLAYTVMSYRSYEGQTLGAAGEDEGYTNGDWDFPQTLMMWDIAALQHMYVFTFAGAGWARTGDTVYAWNPNTGHATVNGQAWLTPGGNKVFLTVWDTDGNDTYDLSAYTTDLNIDLNPGKWSTISAAQIANLGDGYFAPGNIANAVLYQGNGLIENATGGAGNDTLLGNQAANTLVGNGGNDLLDGGTGADLMVGGLGNDRYKVDNAGDVIVELAEQGEDSVETAISFTLSTGFEHLTATVHTGLNLTGNDLVNIIAGGNGNDVLDGKAGADRMIGGAGNDTYHVDDAGDIIDDFSGSDTVVVTTSYVLTGDIIENVSLAGTANLNATGNGLANRLTGNSGDNILDGAGGTDVMNGGLGNDIYHVDVAGEAVEEFDAGIDEVRTALAAFTLGSNFENLTGLGAGGQTLTGNGLANIITGGAGSDVIDGGAGADTMIGGLGDDLFKIDNVADLVVEIDGGGTDSVQSSLTHILAAWVENLALTGSALIDGTGNGLANTIVGNAANNVLDGGAGDDVLDGRGGNDVYLVDGNDLVIEAVGSGIDEVRTTAASFDLSLRGNNVENLTGLAALGQTLIGNSLANVIVGGDGNDLIEGGAGGDTMRGGLGDDVYVDDLGDSLVELAGEGIDEVRTSRSSYTLGDHVERLTGILSSGQELVGNALDNIITGGGSADTLDGGAGADTLIGGSGSDVYRIDAFDTIVELAGQFGSDEVQTGAASYTLGAHLEILRGTSDAGQVLTGNELNNGILGGAGNDILDGGPGGIDQLYGGSGNDLYWLGEGDNAVETANGGIDEVRTTAEHYSLGEHVETLTILANAGGTYFGNAGHNLLVGGLGSDFIYGGVGNDVYVLGEGDHAFEQAGQGNDEVRTARAAYTLGDNIEYLTGTSSFGQQLTGNALSNIIQGGAGNDTLDGRDGNDTLRGGLGDDVYIVFEQATVIEEAGAGVDEIRTFAAFFTLADNVENLTGLSQFGQNLTGNALANLIVGGSGNDDMLGGLGDDTYVVIGNDLVFEVAGEGVDTVRTSNAAYDASAREIENLVGLGQVDQVFTGNASANFIDGGLGNDMMSGGLGNDTYVVDSAGDVVAEAPGEGTDTIRTSLGDRSAATVVRYVLGAAVENLTGILGKGQSLEDNAANNVITTGNGADLIVVRNGGDDTVSTGSGADFLFFGAAFTTLDNVDTGSGRDKLGLHGDYSLVLSATSLAGVEKLLMWGSGDPGNDFDYAITTHDGNVAAGALLEVTALSLGTYETLIFNGAAETNGRFWVRSGAGDDMITGGAGADRIMGGLGADILTGGGGADRFDMLVASHSTSTTYDTLVGFDASVDRINVQPAFGGWGGATSGALSKGTLDAQLATMVNDIMGNFQAVKVVANDGDLAGKTFVVFDANGDGSYVAGQDLVWLFEAPAQSNLEAFNFFL